MIIHPCEPHEGHIVVEQEILKHLWPHLRSFPLKIPSSGNKIQYHSTNGLQIPLPKSVKDPAEQT